MKRIFIAALALAALSSCTFVHIDTKALRALLEEDGIEIDSGKNTIITAGGSLSSEIRADLPSFSGIESSIPVDIEYSDGEQFVEITAPGNVLPFIETRVDDVTLRIHFKGVRVRKAKDIKAVIRTPKLRFIELNGAGDIDMKGPVVTDDFNISINGAGDVDVDDLTAGVFEINVSGACDVDIEKVVCTKLDADISGAGDLQVKSIDAQEVKVTLAGAGDCTLEGHTVDADLSVSGAGTIDVRNLKVDNNLTDNSKFWRKSINDGNNRM